MKCANHIETDASAVCVNCGTAVCRECSITTTHNRIVCSERCRQHHETFLNTVGLMENKTRDQNTVCMYLLLMVGGVELVLGLIVSVWGIWQLSLFCLSLGTCMVCGGFWLRRLRAPAL